MIRLCISSLRDIETLLVGSNRDRTELFQPNMFDLIHYTTKATLSTNANPFQIEQFWIAETGLIKYYATPSR